MLKVSIIVALILLSSLNATAEEFDPTAAATTDTITICRSKEPAECTKVDIPQIIYMGRLFRGFLSGYESKKFKKIEDVEKRDNRRHFRDTLRDNGRSITIDPKSPDVWYSSEVEER